MPPRRVSRNRGSPNNLPARKCCFKIYNCKVGIAEVVSHISKRLCEVIMLLTKASRRELRCVLH